MPERTDLAAESHSGQSSATRSSAGAATVLLGLDVEPALRDLADEITADLGEGLNARYDEVSWEVRVSEGDGNAAEQQTSALMAEARRGMVAEGWDLAISLTKLPLRKDGRPVIALTSATDGVGVVSVPALGAVGVGSRAREAILDLVEG